MAREARRRGVQGVVCGHIHHAEMREIDGILYCNDGDWVESLTALVEHCRRPARAPRLAAAARAPREAAPAATAALAGRMKIALVTRRLVAAGQRRGHDAGRNCVSGLGGAGPRGGAGRALGLSSARPCPGYAGIELAVAAGRAGRPPARRAEPDAIHIATEGPARLRRPPLLPAARAPVHHGVPHALSGDPDRGAAACRSPGATRCSGASTRRRRA